MFCLKRKILYGLLGILIVLIVGLVICKLISKDDVSDNVTTLKVSEVTHSIFYTPFYVAIENGYFKEENINIDLMLVSGSDNVAASVLSGDTEIGLAGPESAIYVYLGGEKNYLQVFAGLTKRDGQFILARNNNEFKWQDLVGKEILVGRSTGMPALSFFKALENKGIDKSEVNINTRVEFSELSGTFISGVGDYVNLFEPLATKLEDNKNGYVVQSVGQISGAMPYTAFYARKSYIENNKKVLKSFVKSIKKGMEYTLNNDGNKVAQIIHKQFSDTNISDLGEMINRYKESDAWLSSPFIEEDFYNTLMRLLKDNNLIEKDVPYQKLVNNIYE